MPDRRQHRGPHPQDRLLFADQHHAALREAGRDLSWLLTRGYSPNSALKLVGDRYQLNVRQRLAVSRCACSDPDRERRRRHELQATDLDHRELWIDGYNVLTSIEAALAGAVILHARDGCYRDMASMHGNYRKVEETVPAICLIGEAISQFHVECCRWYLDAPVSNSGRLRGILLEAAAQHEWCWTVELVADPDPILSAADAVVASADSQILDVAERWFNLARIAVEQKIRNAWIVDLSS